MKYFLRYKNRIILMLMDLRNGNKNFDYLVGSKFYSSARKEINKGKLFNRIKCVLHSNHLPCFIFETDFIRLFSEKEINELVLLCAIVKPDKVIDLINRIDFIDLEIINFAIRREYRKNDCINLLINKKLTDVEKISINLILASNANKDIKEYLERDAKKKSKLEEYKVTVIIPVYNVSGYIKRTIESIMNQTHHNLEIIVVDDCSTDNTYEILEKLECEHDIIQLFRTAKNSGPYFAKNIGLEKSTGDFITFIDGDDVAIKSRIAIQLENLKVSNLDVNMSNWIRVEDENKISDRNIWPLVRLNMGSVMISRSLFNKAGYFHEIRHSADQEYVARLKLIVGKMTKIRAPLTIAARRPDSLTGDKKTGFSNKIANTDRQKYFEKFSLYHKYCIDSSTSMFFEKGDKLPFMVPKSLRLI